MEPEDRVSLEITRAARGEIKDRKGKGLAVNGDALEVGVIPEKMIENEQAVKSELARLLNITVDDIDQALNASWVKPNYFVPIKRIPHTESGLMEKLQQLPGVQINKVSGRVYPLGEAAAHLIGYVDEVTAEDLEKNKKYRPGDMIGKRGLEQLFEERLQGDHGVTISLEKPDGTKTTVVQKPVKNGEDIQLTIDSSFQQEIMKKFNGKEGTAIALHPKTGETLAIVSSPAFNPNTFMYMTAKERKNLEENPAEPLVNRFVYPHTPGSVMKPFTAAIGLENGTITPKMAKEITGTKWQKDKTWGGYYVTRVSNPGHPINLEDALVLSDNIYFAQTALDMGADQYIKGLTKFGFGEEIPYIYPLKPSQISNDGKFKNDILLADSSYGQGEVQTNIVHLAAGYTAFINDGNIIKPILLTEEKKGQIWKEAVIEKNTAKIINDSLRQVVASPRGTAHSVNMEDLPLAGKTGTAEIAKSGQGKQGIENGWFVAYNADSHDLLIALTMEEVQGQGKITSQAVKELFEFYKAN